MAHLFVTVTTHKVRLSPGAERPPRYRERRDADAAATIQKVRLSAAERQRHFRARRDADPVKRQEYLLQSKTKYQRLRQTGMRKLVKEMSVAEHALIKDKWKRSKQRKRNRLKNMKKVTKIASEVGTCTLQLEVTEIEDNMEATNHVKALNQKVDIREVDIKTEVE